MVASKRCKICAALDPENIAIYGEYFGNLLPDLIEKISGTELDPRKANGVLICKFCAIQVVNADLFIDKLRNSVQRLKKVKKEIKPKTPITKTQEKKIGSDESKTEDKSETDKIDLKAILDESKTPDKPKSKTVNKIISHKSASPNLKSTTSTTSDDLYEKDNEVSEIHLKKMLAETKTQNEAILKTPKKTPKRKPDFSNDKNAETPNLAQKKFKKISDDSVATLKRQSPAKPTKNKGLKEMTNNIKQNGSDMVDSTTPMKLNNKISACEDSPMDLTMDDSEENASKNESVFKTIKLLNCSICGKAFNQKRILRDHIETSHMGERLKACPHCSSEFRSTQKYESHVFSEKCKNANHACQYPKCNKRFKTVHKMELHMQEKHSSQNESEVD